MKTNLTLLRYLTIRRGLNALFLGLSFLLSRLFKKNLHFGMPMHVSIEPTTACNLACPECPSGLKRFTRATGKLDLEAHRTWLEQIRGSVFYTTYYFQGEPFLHPQFLSLIQLAHSFRMFTATSTNAHFIDAQKAYEIVDSGLDQLIISVDGISQEVYEQYRVQGTLEKVWQATEYLVAAKKARKRHTPRLIFQCLAVKPNEHEIPLLFERAKTFGVDEVRIKSAQLYDYENGHPLMPDNPNYSRYVKKANGKYVLKNPGGNSCWRMWSGSVITWDGKIVPCCFDKDAQNALGALSEGSFRTIWKSDAYNAFRQSILTARNDIEICTNCSEGSKVWL